MSDLSYEVGHLVDGLLGAPYLREFYVTVDYPNRTLRLYRYADESYILDDYRRVGIELGTIISATGNSFVVQRVYPGTDAERKGIRERDNILSIDGQFLFALDAAAVDRKLRGPVGTSRQLGFAGSRTVDVLVDELLPLP
jgi:C-terminal processing protease CtpA/Prc